MKGRKTSYLAILLSTLAADIVTPVAISYAQTNTQSYGNVTSDNATGVTAAVNGTSTANVTGNQSMLADTNETAVAGENVTVTVTPFAQVPGRSTLVQAEGLEPDTNATITVDGELAANTETDGNGTLLYALGVPSEPITKMIIRVDDSGEETITNETHAWEGTVNVIVEDQAGNRGSSELTVIAPLDQSNQTSTAGANITQETLDRFLD